MMLFIIKHIHVSVQLTTCWFDKCKIPNWLNMTEENRKNQQFRCISQALCCHWPKIIWLLYIYIFFLRFRDDTVLTSFHWSWYTSLISPNPNSPNNKFKKSLQNNNCCTLYLFCCCLLVLQLQLYSMTLKKQKKRNTTCQHFDRQKPTFLSARS